MRQSNAYKKTAALLSVSMIFWILGPPVAAAQETVSPIQEEDIRPEDVDLDEVRELIQDEKDYDRARELLDLVLNDSAAELVRQQQAHVVLVEWYVERMSDATVQERHADAEDIRKSATAAIQDCLNQPHLRHTKPGIEANTIAQRLFAEERNKIFGSLRVSSLIPEDAVVKLDGEPLTATTDDGFLGEPSLYTGPHTILAEAEGYEPYTQNLDVRGGQLRDVSIRLEKKEGGIPTWVWAAVAGGLAGGVGLALSGGGGDSGEEPLPGPPDPPGQ